MPSKKSKNNATDVSKKVPPRAGRKGGERKDAYEMQFDIGTIKHLGLQMYSTLPPVIGELVSNAWDADASRVDITIPTSSLTAQSEIVVEDGGVGMSDKDVREAYLIVGRDRRLEQGDKPTAKGRRLQGRKGIGKFSAFGIAGEIEVETVKNGETSRFIMNYGRLEKSAALRKIRMPPLPPTGLVKKGTKVTLRNINKYRNRPINIPALRRGLARRFSIIGREYGFEIYINGSQITPQERDLRRLLDLDADGKPYIWEYDREEIETGTGWRVSGWIGALNRTNELEDGIQRGIVIFARGKMVQAPFVFEATVGQQYALSYLVGELHAEFVDEAEDTIGTTRNSLVWDIEPNATFKRWGQAEVNRIARQWAEKRSDDNERELLKNPLYSKFREDAGRFDNRRILRVADTLIRDVIKKDTLGDQKSQETVIQLCLDFMEFDAFQELAQELVDSNIEDTGRLLELFREWEVVEAKEMMRVTKGRISTIEKLQRLIDTNALEVPTLHKFLKEFPWVLDPRWTLVADEVTYSSLLKEKFPEGHDVPVNDRRIDFLCVKESNNLVVVEIKRPKSVASVKQLQQIEEYVNFMRNYVSKTTDPDLQRREVVGYLLCGDLVNTWEVEGRRNNIAKAGIYVRRYDDLLQMVRTNHNDFLKRYDELRKAKSGQKDVKKAGAKTTKKVTPKHLSSKKAQKKAGAKKQAGVKRSASKTTSHARRNK
jgi:hypothetical protein